MCHIWPALLWCARSLKECCSAARFPQLQRRLLDVSLFWLAGRLLCDTYLGARELLREVDYTMTTLARIHLGQNRSDLAAADVAGGPFAPSEFACMSGKNAGKLRPGPGLSTVEYAGSTCGLTCSVKAFRMRTLDAHRHRLLMTFCRQVRDAAEADGAGAAHGE